MPSVAAAAKRFSATHVSCDRYLRRAVIVNDDSHDSIMINERNLENWLELIAGEKRHVHPPDS